MLGWAQVQQLESKLAELEEDRKELARFQQVDRQRRSLEYTIYDKEVTDTTAKLEQVGPCSAAAAYTMFATLATAWGEHNHAFLLGMAMAHLMP